MCVFASPLGRQLQLNI